MGAVIGGTVTKGGVPVEGAAVFLLEDGKDVYAETTQADFATGTLVDVVAKAGGLELDLFKPTDISGCRLWLDASQITGLSDGDPVGTWSDLSGNGRHATQSGAARPTYRPNVVNGRSVVRFTPNQWLSLPNTVVVLQQTASFVVMQSTDTSNKFGLCARSVGTNNRWYCPNLQSDFHYSVGAGALVTPRNDNWNIHAQSHGSNTHKAWLNGSLVGTRSDSNSGTPTGQNIGSYRGEGDYLNGDIAEVIVYNHALSDADRLKVETYLAQKYGITIAEKTALVGVGHRTSPPIALSGTNPGLRLSWQATTPAGTSVTLETAVTGETGGTPDTPAETAEVQTLYLGGATGGTFTLGKPGNVATLAYNSTAAAIQTALVGIFGSGRVTVAAGTDFTITFDTIVRNSGLTANFANLTGATNPALTVTTAYDSGDWAEQVSGELISNIPAGDLAGKHLWLRQRLETTDTSAGPTLTKAKVYIGAYETRLANNTYTDENGGYLFNNLLMHDRYTVICRYVDGEGNMYNAPAKPFLTPHEEG